MLRRYSMELQISMEMAFRTSCNNPRLALHLRVQQFAGGHAGATRVSMLRQHRYSGLLEAPQVPRQRLAHRRALQEDGVGTSSFDLTRILL